MSSKHSGRTVRLPPRDFASRRIPVTRLESAAWYRAHVRGGDPLRFSRNPEHRFSHPQSGCHWLYLGSDFETCVWERLGDRLFDKDGFLEKSLWIQLRLSEVSVPGLEVCDLSDTKTLSACRVDAASLQLPTLDVPHLWGMAIAKHPLGFQGILYRSRFTSRLCMALIDRGNLRHGIGATTVADFSDYPAAGEFLDRHRVALI